ncbi:MAG: HAMP domain-containing protein [Planctomycetes bacterium]|nr:HAMP domain-containing protein [Planctomycetota bacterium]
MSNATLRTQFLVFTIASALLAAVIGFVAWNGARTMRDAQAVFTTTLEASNNHMDADMMHDALRSDVLEAILTGQHPEKDKVELEAALKEHCARFNEDMAKNDALPLPDEVKAALAEARPALDAYIRAANTMVELAFKDPVAAEASLPDFMSTFLALEAKNEELGERIEASAKTAQAEAEAANATTTNLILGAVVLGALAILALGYYIRSCVSRRAQELANAMERMSAGDFSPGIESGIPDEIGRIAVALGKSRGTIEELVSESSKLIAAARSGSLDVRAPAERFQGSYSELCNGMNHMLDAVAKPIQESSAVLAQLASGNLSQEVRGSYQGEFQRMAGSVNETIRVLRSLVDQMNTLIQASNQGQLSTRADAAQFQGSYRELVGKVNGMLDAIATPINEASRILECVSRGDLSQELTGRHVGDYAKIQTSLNETVRVLRNLLAEFDQLVKDSTQGKLSSRARDGEFQGGYKELCGKVNQMLEGILAPIHESTEVLKSVAKGDLSRQVEGNYKGDHEVIKRNLNETIEVLRLLLKETNSLIESCRAGQLQERIDAQHFGGSYKELCTQINSMLEAVVAPMRESSDVLSRVAERDLTVRVKGRYQGDHATVQQALNAAVEKMQQAIRSIANDAKGLHSSSTQLTNVSTDMQAKSEQGATQVAQVSTATEEISRNIQTVASAAEELNSAIREIAQRSSEASKIASAAVDSVRETNSTVMRLGESSAEIESVIKLITSIAAQTNLLALNATIEAARAGEMGKGFAVVANEVKELANQTSKATEEIAGKISTIQADTRSSVEAMAKVQEIIARINDLQTSIAGAVEEQSATTQEITRNVTDVARGASGIAESISGVSQVAQAASVNAEQVGNTAQDVKRMSEELAQLVQSFRIEVESAHASPVPAALPHRPAQRELVSQH